MRLMNQLPPLNPLRAFEAAGRLKSIRKAAEELSVTAGAVSRQVQILETYLGIPLFRREARAAILTAAGEQYLAEITAHLDGIREATLKLTGVRGRSRDVLKVRAYITFAMKWLIPRLSSFHDANPATEVRITASLEAVDFEHEDVDCAIRLGDGNWPHCEVDKLVANELVPVCSPDYRREAKLKSPSLPAARRRDNHSSGTSSQKNTTTGTFSVTHTSMCSIPLNRPIISTPKHAGLTALTPRIASCNTSGGIAAAPNIPIPPASHTARTRGAVAMNAMPALMKGTFSPYCSVMRVFNMRSSISRFFSWRLRW